MEKKCMKNGEIYHSGQFSVTCTGTVWVLVIFGQHVPVQVRPVPVHAALF